MYTLYSVFYYERAKYNNNGKSFFIICGNKNWLLWMAYVQYVNYYVAILLPSNDSYSHLVVSYSYARTHAQTPKRKAKERKAIALYINFELKKNKTISRVLKSIVAVISYNVIFFWWNYFARMLWKLIYFKLILTLIFLLNPSVDFKLSLLLRLKIFIHWKYFCYVFFDSPSLHSRISF